MRPGAVPGPGWAIGVDLGGTKTEAVALHASGQERWRRRIATPHALGHDALRDAVIALLVQGRSAAAGPTTLGIGCPASLNAESLLKNANTSCRNGRPLQHGLQSRLGQLSALQIATRAAAGDAAWHGDASGVRGAAWLGRDQTLLA